MLISDTGTGDRDSGGGGLTGGNGEAADGAFGRRFLRGRI
jgi:hypothetical protein